MDYRTMTADWAISLTDRRMAYDGEGRELGSLTIEEAARLGDAKYEPESDTITVDTE